MHKSKDSSNKRITRTDMFVPTNVQGQKEKDDKSRQKRKKKKHKKRRRKSTKKEKKDRKWKETSCWRCRKAE